MNVKRILSFWLIGIMSVAVLASCAADKPREVVIYTSVDQVFSEPILKAFEEQSGIRVKPVFDVEAQKTVGLVTRLISERNNVQADVFWNGEIMHTLFLKEEGIIAAMDGLDISGSVEAKLSPDEMVVTFGGRARVLIVNTDLLSPEDYPRGLHDFAMWGDGLSSVGIAYPMFGTTATHAAAIYAKYGPVIGLDFFRLLHQRGIEVVDGNSVVRDMVADGRLIMGLTDTDDAFGALDRGAPVDIVLLDQEPGGLGTMVIPNSIVLMKDAPNRTEALALIQYLVSDEVVARQFADGWLDIVHPSLAPGARMDMEALRIMPVDWDEVYSYRETSRQDLSEIFIR